ncbi:MAG: acyltransferase family protein, partial [Bacteroidales bacterium]
MRRHDLDNLRVLLFLLLILYHVGMFFCPWSFHFKNNEVVEWLVYPMLFLNQWRLPLLFVISGMGTAFALRIRSMTDFVKERNKRLLIPFLFGMLFIVPPQVYFERIVKSQFSGSYFGYLSESAFTGAYPDGNISWHHLWFILYLLLFSVILAPLFIY